MTDTEADVVMPVIVTGAESMVAPGATDPLETNTKGAGAESQLAVVTLKVFCGKPEIVSVATVVVAQALDAVWRTQTVCPLVIEPEDAKLFVHPIEYSPPETEMLDVVIPDIRIALDVATVDGATSVCGAKLAGSTTPTYKRPAPSMMGTGVDESGAVDPTPNPPPAPQASTEPSFLIAKEK